MKNPIKDVVTSQHNHIKFWFGNDPKAMHRFVPRVKFEATFQLYKEGLSDEEIKNMKKYVNDNLKELPNMCYFKAIKINDEVLFERKN